VPYLKSLIFVGVLALFTALAVPVALGSSVHLKHGSSITCTVTSGTNSASVTCTGTGGLSGLGNSDVAFVLGGTGSATFNCMNPGNGNVVPGQNKVPFTASPTTVTVGAGSIKNGNLDFFGPGGNTIGPSTQSAPTPTAKQVGCPSNSWTTTPTAVFFQTIDLAIQQPPDHTIIDCTAGTPNGPALTDTVTLTCS